ncbi:MAG TPA: hypothetical protein VLF66_09535 [Thermoanaerobaculia bacterium]|nr:hypothetical protein [Thermoanaerobaculia bacterium]
MTIARRLSIPLLAVTLLTGCTGVRPPEAPPPPVPEPSSSSSPSPAPVPAPPPPAPPQPPPVPAPEPAGRELSSPMANGDAGVLEAETRKAIREAEEVLAALDEEETRNRREAVAAVRSLLEQSRSALAGGEIERAHNLARKARELAGEL